MAIFDFLQFAKTRISAAGHPIESAYREIMDERWFAINYRDQLQGRTDVFAFFWENRLNPMFVPNPFFDASWYMHFHPDLHGKVPDPLAHYLQHGMREQRSPGPLFDAKFYTSLYGLTGPDANPLKHYLHQNPNSFPNPLFDGEWYLEQYPEVAGSGLTPMAHYLLIGARKRYNPCLMFDTDWYSKAFPEVEREGNNPLSHYLRGGDRHGYDPSRHFNSQDYLQRNPDVHEAKVNALSHYVTEGFFEGRPIVGTRQIRQT